MVRIYSSKHSKLETFPSRNEHFLLKDCDVSCGGAAKKRYGRQADDLSTTPSPTSNDDQATTQSVFMPLETTASMVLDEFEQALFDEEKDMLASKTRLTIKFGPFDWVDMVQTTEATTVTEEVTKPSLDIEIENLETPKPETQTRETIDLETTAAKETEVDLEKEVEEILEEVERKLEEAETDNSETDKADTGIPGWMPLYGIIGAGIIAFITGFVVVVKFTNCRSRQQPKLLN